ncbi:MAG: histidine kinase-, DNA gyrase B-, and HSP90-like ATPase [halophilic archaeon J07HB67]|nr:MAG: histidine kinase-, DNA gyrase B-, and HSP90-like ATPase [halophilic archaeon J07HB67]
MIDDRRRVFDTSVEPVSDHRGQTTGYAVVVHDVTERHAYEKRLEVANRVLRHNLSNELNVVLGHANHVADAATDPGLVAAAEEIRAAAVGLEETSEKARELVGSQPHHGNPEAIAVAEPTRRVAAQFGAPAEVRVSVVDTRAIVGSRQAYITAVENLVENAVEHHDGDATVWIDVGETDDEVIVTVADDGPGVPETDRVAVERGSETPLEHTSGLGLWIAHWTATAVGGELRLGDREPRGTRVELRLPAADASPDDTDASAIGGDSGADTAGDSDADTAGDSDADTLRL